MSFLAGVILLAVVTAVACALPGVFVVLRRESMVVDAMAHAVLPGIVLGYALTHDLRSPVLIVGAAAATLLVVLGSEYLARTGLVAGDAPVGLIFPALFAFGVLLVSRSFGQVHLDTHAVLVGDINLATFTSLTIGGVDLGPRHLWVMLALAVLNAAVIAALYRPLVLVTVDPSYARSIGIRVTGVTTVLMVLVALTVTAAFHAAGAVLVIALIVAPAASASLLTRRIPALIGVTLVIAAAVALGGFWVAYLLDLPTGATMAVGYGVVFLATLVVTGMRRRRVQPTDPAAAAPDTAHDSGETQTAPAA